MPRKRKWSRFGGTYVLMELNADNMVPEWHVIGYVLKRKVYDSIPTGWYAFKVTGKVTLNDVPCQSCSDAKELVEGSTPTA